MSSNSTVHAIAKRKCGAAAVAIRELEIRIAFADSSKFAAVQEVIAHVVEVICTGTYDVTIGAGFEFEQVARPALSSRVKSASKTIVVGIIPIAVILGLRYGGIELSSQFNNWAVAVAVVWAVITFVSALDPLYSNKLRTIQDFISALRGKGE